MVKRVLTRVCAAALLWCGCTACSGEEDFAAADSTAAVRCCKVEADYLSQGFEQAILTQNGFCIMGRSRDEGYELILGHVDSLDKSVVVCCDADNRPRELFAEDVLICLNDASDGGIYMDIMPKDSEPYGFLCETGYAPKTRASGEAGDQVASGIAFGLSLQSLKEYSEVVFGPAKKYLKPQYANAGKALARPGLIFSAIGLAGAGVDMPRWMENLTNAGALATDVAFWAKFGGGAIGGPVSMFIGSYVGLYARYRELYEEHISVLYGDCMAVTGKAAVKGTSATLSAEITGYEPWYDLECGIVVSPLPGDESPLKKVTCNGGFSRTVDGLEPGKTYRYRAFVISETRMSLWAGLLGDLAGPLVRYGEWKKFTVPQEASIVGTWGCIYTKYVYFDGRVKEWYVSDEEKESSDRWYYIFREDDTGERREKGGRWPFVYRLESSGADYPILSINETNEEFDHIWQIQQLTNSDLELYEKDSYGFQCWARFERIK